MLKASMAKKKLISGFELDGIAPNLLLKQVENTAPFLFKGELNTEGKQRAYLAKLKFYKKNLKQLNHINLTEYFHICLCAHWTTAGTFVPTDVDNQIRQKLWLHKSIQKNIHKMTQLTLEAWQWDYSQVTNRKSYNKKKQQVLATHEGTWLSVAIGAYCALKKYQMNDLAQEVAETILAEIKKEEDLLLHLRETKDHLNFIRTAPLMAHNFGDLDRVMVAWDMHEKDHFCQKIYRLGHKLNPDYSPILVYTGKVNKKFTAQENHRHMSLRTPKCLRKSADFLVPVGPFMDEWGGTLGASQKLNLIEKAEIIVALFEGFKRQKQAKGYARALGALLKTFETGLEEFEAFLAFDVYQDLKKSSFYQAALIPREEFEQEYIDSLNQFEEEISGMKF